MKHVCIWLVFLIRLHFHKMSDRICLFLNNTINNLKNLFYPCVLLFPSFTNSLDHVWLLRFQFDFTFTKFLLLPPCKDSALWRRRRDYNNGLFRVTTHSEVAGGTWCFWSFLGIVSWIVCKWGELWEVLAEQNSGQDPVSYAVSEGCKNGTAWVIGLSSPAGFAAVNSSLRFSLEFLCISGSWRTGSDMVSVLCLCFLFFLLKWNTSGPVVGLFLAAFMFLNRKLLQQKNIASSSFSFSSSSAILMRSRTCLHHETPGFLPVCACFCCGCCSDNNGLYVEW